ncbi:MAG TPA: YdeI/OmpD-associated family protein [Gemmatimonadales bacterium]
MSSRDPRIDAYIEKSAPFAQPILRHIRQVVHEATPDIEETMKWSFPHFTHEGRIICSMASFKEHCALGFWRGGEVLKGKDAPEEKAMGQFGRIASLDDLPPREELAGYVRKAVELRASEAAAKKAGTKAGTKTAAKPAAKRSTRPEIPMPEAMTAALAGADAARTRFEAFSPSHRREYVEWIAEAKTDATRDRRIAQMLEWVAEGKPRNWKYMKC